MKVDKEVLLKHHFWILLGVLIPMVLIALVVLWTATAGAIEAKQKEFDASEKSLKNLSGPKNQKWLDALKVREDEVRKQKDLIWGEAWERQKDLLTWPEGLSEERQALDKKYFAENIDWHICEKYSQPEGGYREQFEPMINLVHPVNEKGEGMVQFQGGWEAIIKPFDLESIPAKNRPIPPEELWILQEDIAVYRELLRIINDVNELVATFHEQANPPKVDPSKGEIDHQIFTNSNWKLDLIFAETKGAKTFPCTVTNISHRRQPLGIFFLIKIKGIDEPQFIFVDGEPLAPGASIAVKDKDGHDQGPQTQSGTFEGKVLERVVQYFDWRTAPVKRIDRLLMGYPSQRTASRPLKTLKKWETAKETIGGGEEAPVDKSATEGGMAQMGERMKGMMGRFGGMGGGFGFGGGAGGGGDATKNGLPKNRYVDISDQVRRMPIAIAVVIDQDHIADFLTVVANSRLRIQTTQIYWNRFKEDIKPKITKEEEKPGSKESKPRRTTRTGPRAGMPSSPMAGGFGGFDSAKMGTMMQGMQNMRKMMMMGTRSGMGGGFQRFGGGPAGVGGSSPGRVSTQEAEEELDANLVELGVHGIASLYEKYPPPPEPTAAAPNQ